MALLIPLGMFVLADRFGFEGIFGAFAAGRVVGLATRGEAGKPMRAKLDAVAFGWFYPFFFVGTGIRFSAMPRAPGCSSRQCPSGALALRPGSARSSGKVRAPLRWTGLTRSATARAGQVGGAALHRQHAGGDAAAPGQEHDRQRAGHLPQFAMPLQRR